MIGLRIIVAGNVIADVMPEKEANDLVRQFFAGTLPPMLQRQSPTVNGTWQWAVRTKDVLAMYTALLPPEGTQGQGPLPIRGSGYAPFKN